MLRTRPLPEAYARAFNDHNGAYRTSWSQSDESLTLTRFRRHGAPPEVIDMVARLSECPADVLALLSRDADEKVVDRVCTNRSTSAAVLREAGSRVGPITLARMMSNPSAPLDLLEAGLHHDDRRVVEQADRSIHGRERELISRFLKSLPRAPSPAVPGSPDAGAA